MAIVNKDVEEKALVKKEEEVPNLFPVARALFRSNIFPNVKNEFGAYAVVQYGHELGIGPMTALQSMSIVQGKICMSGQMMLSIALRNGVTYEIRMHNDKKCEIFFKNGKVEFLSSFSIEEAKQAGIWKAQGGWDKYPQDMLFWRTVTRGLRRVCPDAILGLYAKEELEDAPPLDSSKKKDVFEKAAFEQDKGIYEGIMGQKELAPNFDDNPPEIQPEEAEDERLVRIHTESEAKYEENKKRIEEIKNKFELRGYWLKHKGELENSLLPEHFNKLEELKEKMKVKFDEKGT